MQRKPPLGQARGGAPGGPAAATGGVCTAARGMYRHMYRCMCFRPRWRHLVLPFGSQCLQTPPQCRHQRQPSVQLGGGGHREKLYISVNMYRGVNICGEVNQAAGMRRPLREAVWRHAGLRKHEKMAQRFQVAYVRTRGMQPGGVPDWNRKSEECVNQTAF